MKENPKYRSWDSPAFVEPKVDYGESLTDPSQNIPIAQLVANHVRMGNPPHGLTFGDDLSRVGFTELALKAKEASATIADQQAAEAKLKADAAAKAIADRRAVMERVDKALKAGSPEVQALAAELTRVLPGFEASVAGADLRAGS